ncbi:MAG: NAD(P)-dependent alcohol dehydrogenase [Lachnotalea sp.]
MKIALMEKPGDIKIKEVAMPEPKDNELLVQIKHVGICGSDIHYYEHGRIGDFVVENPIILGHECAGIVTGMGKDVTGFTLGDVVALEPGHTCGKCEFCLSGRYNLCPDVVFMATPPYDGAFCECVAYPSHMAFKLPIGIDTMEGALIEPLAVGMHATNQGKAQLGQSAVILGSGCIGLCTLLSLKAKGVTTIYVVDVIEKRLTKAEELGATKVINGLKEDTIETIMQLTEGKGVDMVYETAGNKITTAQTSALVKRGGTIILVGMAPDPTISYDFGTLMGKEASIKTVFRYRNIYPSAIAAVAAGMIPIKGIVTDTFKLANTAQAMEYSVKNKADIVKAVIEM